MVTIGIDPHKTSHTAAALDASGETLGELRLRADGATLSRLGAWAAGWPQRVWAIEGAGGLGRCWPSNSSPPAKPWSTSLRR